MAKWSEADIPDLTGRVAIVTGPTGPGIGQPTARLLADHGMHVILAARNEAKLEAARRSIVAATGADSDRLEPRLLDLADLSSVASFADGVLADHRRLDLLVNNAGVVYVPEGRTADAFELHFGVNHLGTMALTLRLLPILVAKPAARVVTVTSLAYRLGRIRFADPNFYTGGYTAVRGYSQSKLANLLFTVELGRRLAGAGHDTLSVAAHPGLALSEQGIRELTSPFQRFLMRLIAQSNDNGALPSVRAATDPHARSGQLYGPDGFTRVRGAPTLGRPQRRINDLALATGLWDLSLQLIRQEEPVTLSRG